jgi:hypothetical protein
MSIFNKMFDIRGVFDDSGNKYIIKSIYFDNVSFRLISLWFFSIAYVTIPFALIFSDVDVSFQYGLIVILLFILFILFILIELSIKSRFEQEYIDYNIKGNGFFNKRTLLSFAIFKQKIDALNYEFEDFNKVSKFIKDNLDSKQGGFEFLKHPLVIIALTITSGLVSKAIESSSNWTGGNTFYVIVMLFGFFIIAYSLFGLVNIKNENRARLVMFLDWYVLSKDS